MNKIIICLIGEMGVGKGTVAQHLKSKHKAKILRFSDPIQDVLNRLGQRTTRKNLTETILAIRKIFGDDILAKILINDFKKSKNKIVVFDGMRKQSELQLLKNTKNFYTIFITADLKTRYRRIATRNEKHDDQKKRFQTFKKEQKFANEIEINKIGQKANFKINNSGTKKELYLQIDKIIKQINEKK